MDKFIYYYIPLILELIKAFSTTAIATAVIETVFFSFLKYQKKYFLIFIFIINLISNILLNIYISYANIDYKTIMTSELVVVLVEYIATICFLKTDFKASLVLFVQILFANILSYSIGIIWFSIMKMF